MKKIILSMVMVAICGLAHAANAVETPKVEKGALMISLTIEDVQLLEEDQCINTILPICSGGQQVGSMSAIVCAEDPYAFCQSLSC